MFRKNCSSAALPTKKVTQTSLGMHQSLWIEKRATKCLQTMQSKSQLRVELVESTCDICSHIQPYFLKHTASDTETL